MREADNHWFRQTDRLRCITGSNPTLQGALKFVTPWLGLQLEGLHSSKTGMIGQD